MGVKLLSALSRPFITYFDATLGESLRALLSVPDEDFGSHHVHGHLEAHSHVEFGKRNKRERKPTFSFFRCLKEQRKMVSRDTENQPSVTIESVREHYLREAYEHHDSSPFVH